MCWIKNKDMSTSTIGSRWSPSLVLIYNTAFLGPVRYSTSKSNSWSSSPQRATFRVALNPKSHFKGSLSYRNVRPIPSRYFRRKSTAQMTAEQSLSVLS